MFLDSWWPDVDSLAESNLTFCLSAYLPWQVVTPTPTRSPAGSAKSDRSGPKPETKPEVKPETQPAKRSSTLIPIRHEDRKELDNSNAVQEKNASVPPDTKGEILAFPYMWQTRHHSRLLFRLTTSCSAAHKLRVPPGYGESPFPISVFCCKVLRLWNCQKKKKNKNNIKLNRTAYSTGIKWCLCWGFVKSCHETCYSTGLSWTFTKFLRVFLMVQYTVLSTNDRIYSLQAACDWTAIQLEGHRGCTAWHLLWWCRVFTGNSRSYPTTPLHGKGPQQSLK